MPAALAVIAHPDDESFGLGAVLAALVSSGTTVDVLCFTAGEASTLGATEELGALRRDELRCAAERLGVGTVTVHDFPDGGLGDVESVLLDCAVSAQLGGASLLVAFEPGGVTGHPDHRAATAAATRVAADRGLPVLQWGITPEIAEQLNAELGTTFVGLGGVDALDITVDRAAQLAAIECHDSQARDNPVLRRRLELQGEVERVRYVSASANGERQRADVMRALRVGRHPSDDAGEPRRAS